MRHIRKLFLVKGFDEAEYKRVYHRCQVEYLRTRLRCIKTFAEGHEFDVLPGMIGRNLASCRKYIRLYLEEGFAGVIRPDARKHSQALSTEQQQEFTTTLLETRPCDHGLDGNIWTGTLMQQFIHERYGVCYKSGIYDLLERLGLSHQRAHADYGNASPEDQYAFLQDFRHALNAADRTHRVLSFDEFSVGAIPTPHYGWARKNTRPTVITDEKKETVSMAFSPLTSAKENFILKPVKKQIPKRLPISSSK